MSKFADGDCAYVACGNEKFRDINYAGGKKHSTAFRASKVAAVPTLVRGVTAQQARVQAGKKRKESRTETADKVVGQVQDEISRQRENQQRQQTKTADLVSKRIREKHDADALLDDIKEDTERYATTIGADKSRQLEELQTRITNRKLVIDLSEEEFRERFAIGDKIGEGGFAEVMKCRDTTTDKDWAVKVINKEVDGGGDDRIATELDVMRTLEKNTNLLGLHAVCETDDQQFIVMDLMEDGDLFDLVVAKNFFSERDAAEMIKG